MPANPWPAGIPTAFSSDTFEATAQPITIRTDMDAGPPKVRRRFTQPVRKYKCSIILKDAAQYTILDEFYYLICQGGTDTIALNDPITLEPMIARFFGPITYTAIGIAWQAEFELERLPQ